MVAQAQHSREVVTHRRARIIKLSAAGKTPKEIAEHVGMHVESVRFVLRKANRGSVEPVLYPRQGQRGPKPRLEANQIAALLALMHRSPADYGLATQRWTLTDLAETAAGQGVIPRISPSRLWRVLTAHGRSWKQAKRRMTSPDPAYEEKRGSVSSLSR